MTQVYEEKSLRKIEMALRANSWLGWEPDLAKIMTLLDYFTQTSGDNNDIYLLISKEGDIIASSNMLKSWIGTVAEIYPLLLDL